MANFYQLIHYSSPMSQMSQSDFFVEGPILENKGEKEKSNCVVKTISDGFEEKKNISLNKYCPLMSLDNC